jgi:hypothetical protein
MHGRLQVYPVRCTMNCGANAALRSHANLNALFQLHVTARSLPEDFFNG